MRRRATTSCSRALVRAAACVLSIRASGSRTRSLGARVASVSPARARGLPAPPPPRSVPHRVCGERPARHSRERPRTCYALAPPAAPAEPTLSGIEPASRSMLLPRSREQLCWYALCAPHAGSRVPYPCTCPRALCRAERDLRRDCRAHPRRRHQARRPVPRGLGHQGGRAGAQPDGGARRLPARGQPDHAPAPRRASAIEAARLQLL